MPGDKFLLGAAKMSSLHMPEDNFLLGMAKMSSPACISRQGRLFTMGTVLSSVIVLVP